MGEKMKKNNFCNLLIIVLLVILAIILLNKFTGEIKKSDVLSFYSNLLVVIITVTLGVINYEQTKHIQEEGARENENLRELNKEANETNKKLVNIIERNTELEEQKNIPCLSINNEKLESVSNSDNEFRLELKNIGKTIIKCIDIEEVPEEEIKQGIGKIIGDSLKNIIEILTGVLANCFKDHIEKTDFLSFFEHDVDMIGIDETFNIIVNPKHITSKNGEEIDIIGLSMKIENIYGKQYIQKIILLLEKGRTDSKDKNTYNIKNKYIDIQICK